MPEVDIIKKSTAGPVTLATLAEDLTRIGVTPGMTLLVHSSLSEMGWVCGGPEAVVRALEEILGPKGTLVFPTHTGALSDPSGWENPPVDQAWWETIRKTMPPFSLDMTPTRCMGAIPECFRAQIDVQRSCHPQVSFAARGADADFVVDNHSLANGLGAQSPLARIYELGGSVLSIGVSYDTNTSLHLAEYRANYPAKVIKDQGAPISEKGKRKWVTFEDLVLDSDDFLEIGKAYEESEDKVSKGKIGYAQSTLIPQRGLVDFAVKWMGNCRK